MENKVFEIRDRFTLYAVLATKISPLDDVEEFYMEKYGTRKELPHIILTKLNTLESKYDFRTWDEGRTLKIAHEYIRNNFDSLNHGDVVDVEFIEGESETIKLSLREIVNG